MIPQVVAIVALFITGIAAAYAIVTDVDPRVRGWLVVMMIVAALSVFLTVVGQHGA